MICKQCNQIIGDTMNFCPFCGCQINKDAKKIKIAQKFEVDRAVEDKNFRFVWDEILREKNTYAEYVYERFLRELISPINTPQDFNTCTEKILYLSDKGYSYPYYLYGKALMWAYKEHGLVSGLKYFMAVPQKYEEGKNRVLKMAEFGQASAQASVGLWSMKGTIEQIKNDIKAFKMLKAAADKLHPTALYNLGMCYQNGELGLPINRVQAKKYINCAAFFGEEKAIQRVGSYPLESADNIEVTSIAARYKHKLNFNRLNVPYDKHIN